MQIDGKIRGRKWVSITSCFFVGGGEGGGKEFFIILIF